MPTPNKGWQWPRRRTFHNGKRDFDKQGAVKLAFDLLRKKCIRQGASEQEVEMEVLEDLQFNMVRGFYTAGRNIRTRSRLSRA